MSAAAWPWLTLVLLGAYHGLNPGMGWLFAVALGLQERSRRAVIRAFAPIALGHALSIGIVLAVVAMLQRSLPPSALRYGVAAVLILFGLYKLLAPMSHPRWVGMRVGFRELVAWSFLMATAHGAGLMLAPVLLKIHPPMSTVSAAPPPHDMSHVGGMSGMAGMSHADHAEHIRQAAGASPLAAVAAVFVHTLAMFLVMAAIALIVYEKIGLSILRRAWFNLDLLWAFALIAAGLLTLAL